MRILVLKLFPVHYVVMALLPAGKDERNTC